MLDACRTRVCVDREGGVKHLLRAYNAVRIAWWVFWWMYRTHSQHSIYRIAGINSRFLNEEAVVFLARGREAWRVSHLAIDSWRKV